MATKWMIYGANGYSGKLIARHAKHYADDDSSKPILAGRNAAAIQALATELGCEALTLDLHNPHALAEALKDVDLVLNCAGPFIATVKPLLDACLQSKTHYLDISGELAVFEYCHALSDQAKKQGIVICPGVAFDVVPTESVAVKLKQLLPDAMVLKLGFDGKMALSPGSTITLLEGIANPDLSLYMVREDGQLIKAQHPQLDQLAFEVGGDKLPAMTLTWADLNAAYYSTGIPNIYVYIRATLMNRLSFGYMHRIRQLLRYKAIQKLSRTLIKLAIKGPSTKARENAQMTVFGEATNAKGDCARVDLKLPHGYTFTAFASLAWVSHCLTHPGQKGYFTPAQLAGPDYVQSIPGCSDFVISTNSRVSNALATNNKNSAKTTTREPS